MSKSKIASSERPPVRREVEVTESRAATLARAPVQAVVSKSCEDCRASTAFQLWHDVTLSPSFNFFIDFTADLTIPSGKRAVIELVTAQIEVPAGEKARLRMYTSLGMTASNLDLWVTPQGQVSGKDVFVATHTLRAYTDHDIRFNINRDNASTEGYALICMSGYLADM
jgi:hypothetical protein